MQQKKPKRLQRGIRVYTISFPFDCWTKLELANAELATLKVLFSRVAVRFSAITDVMG